MVLLWVFIHQVFLSASGRNAITPASWSTVNLEIAPRATPPTLFFSDLLTLIYGDLVLFNIVATLRLNHTEGYLLDPDMYVALISSIYL